MNFISGGKVNYGVHHSKVWSHRIPIEVITHTTPEDFEKWGHFKESISMQDIVDWSNVKSAINSNPSKKNL